MIEDHGSNWQKALVRTLAVSILLAFSGFGYAWLAPWSDDMGILVMEPIAVGFALVLFGGTNFLLLRLLRRRWPQWFLGGWSTASMWTSILMGIALSIHFYPPMKRVLEPTREANDAAERLVQRLRTGASLGPGLEEKSLQSVDWKVAPAPKGFFGWSPRDPWVVRLSFRYQDGSVAEATYRLADSESGV